MIPIALETTDQKYFISIDHSLMDSEAFYAFFERIRTEFLAQQMNTDEIKSNWWQKNQKKILNIVSQHTEKQ